MGYEHSIRLYFPADRAEAALLATAKAADDDPRGRLPGAPIRVAVPGGRELVLPFGNHDREPPRLEPDRRLSFSTSLLCEMDDAIWQYWLYGDRVLDGRWYGVIGPIDFVVMLGHQFAEFSFYGAWSVCRLFLDSPSVQRGFREILSAAGGVAGVIDVDGGEFRLLADPSRRVELDLEEFFHPEIPIEVDPDRFTPALLAVIWKSGEQQNRIRATAELVVEQLGPASGIEEFGYDAESVAWVDGFIERERLRPSLDGAAVEKMTQNLGSYLGECVIACFGGAWLQREGSWAVVFSNEKAVFPFEQVRKQFTDGTAEGVHPWFDSIPIRFPEYVKKQKPAKKPWWRFGR